MKKLLLILSFLASKLLAECAIPYSDLISGKYKYSEEYGSYLDKSESEPKIKQMINIYTREEIVKEPTIHKVKKQYFDFLISEDLYNALFRNCSDYENFIIRNGMRGISDPMSSYLKPEELSSWDFGLLIDIQYASKILKNLEILSFSYIDDPSFENGKRITRVWLNKDPKKNARKNRADYINYLFETNK